VSATAAFASISVHGIEGSDGQMLLALGGLILVLAVVAGTGKQWAATIAFFGAVLALVIAWYDVGNVQQRISAMSDDGLRASPGWGLYVALLGAGISAIGAFVLTVQRRQRM
jgi:hypothetical protein